MPRKLSQQQAMRYCRQILIPGFDIDAQEKLLNGKVLQIGVGGLGCACAQYLVAAGLGSLLLVDDDNVELTNLQRQVLHGDVSLGNAKVQSAKDALTRINAECEVGAIKQRLDRTLFESLIEDIDVLVDCTDNLPTRNLLNQLAVEYSKPLVSGAAIRMEGQITTFYPASKGPCYQCLSSLFGEQQLSCVESGIMSPVVGTIGSMQALETIKLLTGFAQPLIGQLQLYDAMTGDWQRFNIPKRADCSVCQL
ncbi:molybdopterin-synthase adenylyltransferase MoeB [Neptunicella sp.]|uniref:molybdopterin-synthase adenylyltransferase MoeB n=1 Tax=Neptunicella sp. TaxID=2125986 RepID=UPI003F68E5D6